MLNSKVKNIGFAVSSFAVVLTASSQEASAQLNIGQNGIQRGLESNYLQYQLSGQDLSKLQGFAACNLGSGLGCDKTGTVLEQILEANNGPSYQDLILKAAGGAENLQNFQKFYGNKDVSLIPYASFWRDGSPSYVDGYQYVLGQTVNRTPVEGLGLVTKNFHWSPLQGSGTSLDLRSGLLNLKYSFGRALLEEVAKMPNVQEQIRALGLESDVTNYYLNTLSSGLRALKSGNNQQLQDSILRVLSMPYYSAGTSAGEEYGRPNVGVPHALDNVDVIDKVYGEQLFANVDEAGVPITSEPEVAQLEVGLVEGETIIQGGGRGFPLLPVAGGFAALALLLLVIGGGNGDEGGSSSQPPIPGTGTVTPDINTPPTGCGIPGTPVISCPPTVGNQPEQVTQVPEPSISITPLLLLTIMLFLISRKKLRTQMGN